MRIAALAAFLAAAPAALEAAPARGRPAPRPAQSREQREADRHFRSGVALFKDGKYAEALAEFERAYEIAPHPLVLYNIASCHRQLSHYADAVTYYRRFLAEGKGTASAERLAGARAELDAILALVARVTVAISPPDGAALIVDGTALDHPEMPLILPAGEHRLAARVPGHPDAERTVRVASGDDLQVDLAIPPVPPPPVAGPPAAPVHRDEAVSRAGPEPGDPGSARGLPAAPRRFAVNAAFGTNLRLAGDTGAPALGASVALGARFELGLDAVLVAYALIPSLRVQIAGDALALHAVAAVPVALTDGGSASRFAAGALGLGVRYRPVPAIALRLESYAAVAGKMHGTSIPAFLGGELWF